MAEGGGERGGGGAGPVGGGGGAYHVRHSPGRGTRPKAPHSLSDFGVAILAPIPLWVWPINWATGRPSPGDCNRWATGCRATYIKPV